MTRRVAALAAVVLTVVAPACSRSDDRPTPSSMPCGRAAGRDASFLSATTELGRLWLWGSRLAYAPQAKSAVVCDLTSGDVRVLGRQRSGLGTIGSVRGSRDTVVWVDFDGVADEAVSGSAWTMYAHDLVTGGTYTIAAGAPKDGYFTLPSPEIEWPYVVWTDLPSTGDLATLGPELVAYDLRDGSRRVLSSSATFPDEAAVTNGLVYFSAKTTNTRDLYVAPADGSAPPRALTHETDNVVTDVAARAGWVMWSLHPKQSDQPVGALPLRGLRAGSTTAVPIGTGHGPQPGIDLVVYFADTLHAVFLVEQRPEVVLAREGIDLGPRWSVDGSRVAFVTVDDPNATRKPAHVHIVDVGRTR